MSTESRPHGGKLDKLRSNTKLPDPDRDRVEALWVAYEQWLASMDALRSRGQPRVEELVRLLNESQGSRFRDFAIGASCGGLR